MLGLGMGVLGLAIRPAIAHDFWLEPASHRVAVNAPLSVQALIGHGADRVAFARNPKHIRRFEVHGPKGKQAVGGLAGGTAGVLRIALPGRYVLAYESTPSLAELDRAAFLAYLEEEGLRKTLAAERASRSPRPRVRELFTRCAKALVSVGKGGGGDPTKAVGMPLELVPGSDPQALRPGASLTVRLMRDGKPLAGTRVTAYRRSAPTKQVHVESDKDGRATFTLKDGRDWLLKAVVIDPAPRRSGAQWQSLWATLTFELAPATTASAAARSPAASPRPSRSRG